MQNEIVFEALCAEVLEELQNLGLGKYSIRNYYYEGMWPMIKDLRTQGKTLYDPVFVETFASKTQQQYLDGIVSIHIRNHVRKTAELLNEYIQTGQVTWHHTKPAPTILLSPYYESLLKAFREYEQSRGAYGDKTLRANIGICRTFFSYLQKKDYNSVDSIALKTISDYLVCIAPEHKSSMDSVQCALRYLCEFLLERKACIDFRPVLTDRPAPRKKLHPAFSKDEVQTILASAQSSEVLSLRDTAVFMIASSVGMRAVDIANLKLCDIVWENHIIRFTQSKTGVEITLPLEPAVGNAIANYILQERPSTKSDALFIRSRAPYNAMTATALGDRLRKHMYASNIDRTPGDGKGFHSFRRYVASSMIDSEVPVDTVKEVLGHTRIDSMKPYIRISRNKLACCALDLTGITVTREELL